MTKEYTVKFSGKADKALSKMDPFDKRIIVKWVEDRLEGCEDPRRYGKGLEGNLPGRWRYRVGSWRLLAHIYDDIVLIQIFEIGRRDKIYKR